MKTRQLTPLVAALAAAFCVLLAGWLLPLPRLVAGADEFATGRLPQVRASVASTGAAFASARTKYLDYVATHDMTALSTTLQSALNEASSSGGTRQTLLPLQGSTQQVQDYLALLQAYAQAGEPYFAALRTYDDTLMAWTRSLGTDPEQYRRDTFPLADYLRLYPAPVGDLTPDILWVHASEVASETLSLREHLDALDAAASTGGNTPHRDVVDLISADVTRVWDLGRSVERVESLHQGYEKVLREYDARVQASAAAANSTKVPALANGLNLLVGAVVLVGLVALFAPRREA
ncbi:MAG: hypothetical protein ACJ78Q_11335 [Chloroflexia bacterium]